MTSRSDTTRTATRWSVAAVALALVGAACTNTTGDTRSAGTAAPASASPAMAPASGLKTVDPAELQAIVDQTVKDEMIPGAVVLLRTPQGEFRLASGTAERGVERPPDVDTHFRIASNTKTMTAAVVLQLAQEGRIGLDDPVSTYVPGVPGGDNITITELLTMRSGLDNFTNSPVMAKSLDDDPAKGWTPEELLAIAFAQPPHATPGAEFEYNNTNYVLLGLVIEKAGGRPLATEFQERLFTPLGMTNTELPARDSNRIPEPFTHGYLYGSSSVALYGTPEYTPEQIAAARAGTLSPTDYTDVNHSFAYAAGGVVSTAKDLGTWMGALVGGRVLGAEYQKMWLDSPLPEDPDRPAGMSYGYGINRLSWGPNTILLHGGETAGYNSSMVRDAANDMTIVVWTNLTVDLQMHPTANSLMLKVIDKIYVQSPLGP
jgi:D-alanyl-D-alanine carboxypeptidase